jgi:hypothetical protein
MRVGKNAVSGALAGRAASIYVPGEYTAQVCGVVSPSKAPGRAAPELCVTFPEGHYDFHRLKHAVTKVTVSRPSSAHRGLAVLYSGRGQTGLSYNINNGALIDLTRKDVVSTQLDGSAPLPWAVSLSSIWIADGVSVTLCQSGSGSCLKTSASSLKLTAGPHDLSREYEGNVVRIYITRAR